MEGYGDHALLGRREPPIERASTMEQCQLWWLRMTVPRIPWRSRVRAAGKHFAAALAALKSPSTINQRLETLTPVLLDSAHSTRYEHEIVAAMADPQIRNIAITGGYGSGKSSLIRTFKEHNPSFKYAAVSLATFRKDGVINHSAGDTAPTQQQLQADEKKPLSAEQISALVERIEETIVQQLLYSVPASKLPRTRLKRITQPSKLRSWSITLALSIASVAVTHLYLQARLPSEVPGTQWLTNKLSWIPAWCAFGIAASIGTWALYQIVRSLSLLNIDGWTIKGGTIESMQHSSVLHKNVDELLYCFQNSETDIVVIEDLDRFGVQDVFFRLREINAIINDSPQINRTIRFIYALNDELFAGSEKTKFFDLILPIVPVINKENSHAKMIELLARRSLKGKVFATEIDEELLETISYRIDDMRVAKNIVNELDIFSEVLSKDLELPLSKIFAMIVVKNLHSDQYWQLTKRTGFLYKLISEYTQWRSVRAETLRSEIASIEQMIVQKQQDVARSIKELRQLSWHAAESLAGVSGATQIVMNHTRYTLNDFLDDGNFQAIAQANNLFFIQNSSHVGNRFSFSGALADMDYERRSRIIEVRDSDLRSDIQAKLDQLRDLHKLQLSQALLDGYQEGYSEELAKHEIIRYLLVSGNLDEDYADYLGHFYGHAIDREDMNLIFTLRQGEDCGVDASIKNPVKFLRKLRPRNIDRGRGIIAELLAHLAEIYTKPPHSPGSGFFERIMEDALAHLGRLSQAFDILAQRGGEANLIRAIYDHRPEILSFILNASTEPTDPSKPNRASAVLRALNANQLRIVERADPGFRHRIASIADASTLASELPPESEAWEWMRGSGVRFDNLVVETEPEVISTLMETETLAPTLAMLEIAARNGEGEDSLKSPVTLSTLYAADRIPSIGRYVASHLPDVLQELIKQGAPLGDGVAVVLPTLKEILEDKLLALQFFETTICKISALEQLEPYLWDSAIRGDRLEDRAATVRSYIEHRVDWSTDAETNKGQASTNSILASYVNTYAEDVAKTLWTGEEFDEVVQEWIVMAVELTDETVLKLLSQTTIVSAASLNEYAGDDRIQLLARNGHLAPNAEIWNAIQLRGLEVKASYLERAWEKLRLTTEEPELDFQLATRIFKSGTLSTDESLRIFGRMDQADTATVSSVIGRLAERALAEDKEFPRSLMAAAQEILQTEGVQQPWSTSLLAAALPAMEWPAVTPLLQAMGGDFARLSAGRTVEVAPGEDIDPVLAALERRKFASTLTPGKKGKVRVNMRKNLN